MPRRTAAEGELTREALIDAAGELFADQGIEGVSIRSINSHAGLAAAAVHYHFGSKGRLLDAVLEREGIEVRSEINKLAEKVNAPVIGADVVNMDDLKKLFEESTKHFGGKVDFVLHSVGMSLNMR